MGYVFISHSRADRAYVEELAAHMESHGVKVWFDYRIGDGERWRDVIQRKVEDCAAMLVVMTPSAEDSRWVENEIDLADARGKPIMTLLLEGEAFFGLRHLQFTDVRGGRLPGDSLIRRLVGPADHTGPESAVETSESGISSSTPIPRPADPFDPGPVGSGSAASESADEEAVGEPRWTVLGVLDPDEPTDELLTEEQTATLRQLGKEVMVIRSAPSRFHLPSCRYLVSSSLTPRPRPVGYALLFGYTPCGVCRPGSSLALRYG